uniref:Transmembrane and immunoglobulin domain containing 3 n=1 Tax=Canis lupus familiaris TaxID=9615 RepID=A0A8C0NWB1_CANLF
MKIQLPCALTDFLLDDKSYAMVMDKKVKESFVLDTASATCNYNAHYKDHRKYCTDHVVLRDTGSQFIITVSCLTKEDTGWYRCGIQWDFDRDGMDFTELVVTDNRGGLASDFWSGKDLGNRTRSCRAFRVIHKADHSSYGGMSILIICILITGLGIISIISHLSKRRRSQRNRRGKGLVRSQKTRQASSVIPTPLVSSLLGSSWVPDPMVT